MVYCIICTLDLKNSENEDKFLTAMANFQAYIRAHEPGTLLHELVQAIDGKTNELVPFKYNVVERYTCKDDFDLHSMTPQMKHLFEVANELPDISLTLDKFDDSNVRARLEAIPKTQVNHVVQEAWRQKGILIFGGARHGVNGAMYTHEAQELGKYIATVAHKPLVYGGGTVGIMSDVARSVQQHNGQIVTVIPRALCPRQVSGEMIGTRIFYTASMSQRKSVMFTSSDTVIALPGGIGTFDELLEVLTLFQLNAFRPKIGLVNVNGFFNPFLDLLHHLIAEGFLETYITKCFVIEDTALKVAHALEQFTPPPSPAASLVWHTCL